jgi:hypothetical protein
MGLILKDGCVYTRKIKLMDKKPDNGFKRWYRARATAFPSWKMRNAGNEESFKGRPGNEWRGVSAAPVRTGL